MLTTAALSKKVESISVDLGVEVNGRDINIVDQDGSVVVNIDSNDTLHINCTNDSFENLTLYEREELFLLCMKYISTSAEKRNIKLSEKEKSILDSLKGVSYIVRDLDGSLYIFRDEPTRGSSSWITLNGPNSFFELQENLFDFIEWEDSEPTKISDFMGNM